MGIQLNCQQEGNPRERMKERKGMKRKSGDAAFGAPDGG